MCADGALVGNNIFRNLVQISAMIGQALPVMASLVQSWNCSMLELKNRFANRINFRSLIAGLLACTAAIGFAQVQVTTYHNDNLRTGLNASETILTPANVSPSKFGLLFSLPVDGQVYAQPLYLSRVTVPGKGVHSVVYVATQHNSVYAFDANNNVGVNAQPLWHVNFGPSIPNWETGTEDIPREVGITSTPVISLSNPNRPLLYVISKVRTTDGYGNPIYTQKLHALSASDGSEMLGGPVTIQGSVAGTGDGAVNGVVTFDPLIQHCRAALLLVSKPSYIQASLNAAPISAAPISAPNVPGRVLTYRNYLYVTYASHGDNGPYHGWVFVYDAEQMKLLKILNTTPNAKTAISGYPLAAGGIWQGGGGPASDGNNVYFATGNGVFDPGTQAYGDAIVRLDGNSFTVGDYFAPSNQGILNDYDADLGSGEAMLLPSSASGSSGKNLLVQSGKEGTIYLLDTANLGHNGGTDNIVQELPYAMGGIWGSPAYFNNSVYFGPQYSGIVSFPIRNGQFTSTYPVSNTQTYYQYPGPTPSISANGTRNGIVWAVQADGYYTGLPAILHAYLATDLSVELYNSASTNGRDSLNGAIKFTTPTIANGKVYVGSDGAIGVFGLGSWAADPVVTPSGGVYATSVSVTASDSTPGAVMYYTTDGSTPTTSSTRYAGSVSITSSTVFKIRAFATGLGPSAVIESDYLVGAVVGNGTGLHGAYFNGKQDPSGTPSATELDSQINFNWNGNSPINGVAGSNWAGEWTGQIQALTTGSYTLTTNSDDGVRVYINGNLLIDNYTYHGPTLNSGTINFVAGQKYNIDIKFFQGGGGSVLQLFWASTALPTQLVPTSQLYPGG